jgi:hypothetical protein
MFIAINIFSSAALAQQVTEDQIMIENSPAQKNIDPKQKRFLVSITPPVGYDGTRGGLIYEALPLMLEVPVYERIGLRFKSSLIYYQSRFQTYGVGFALPIYLEKNDGYKPYHGFYAGPYIAFGERLRPERTSRHGNGVIVGYSWTYENSMQSSLGLTRSSQGETALSLALGKWF